MADSPRRTELTHASKPRAIVITGPTASGKSAVALAVADRIGGEIISMDSRQVYRGMDIGTAKPAREEQARVPHHGLDLIDPNERYSAGQFARDARVWIDDIHRRNKTPVIVGGTMFFLRALQAPLFDEPPLDPARRDRLRHFLNAAPIDMLREWAQRIHPSETTDAIPRDRQRIARLIEVATLTGRTLHDWHRASPALPRVPVVAIAMTLERHALYDRINSRVHDMIALGFVDEVAALLAAGYRGEDPGMNATGYRELIPHLRGERSIDEAITLIQAATRQYARRQITWLRTQARDVTPIDAARPTETLADIVIRSWTVSGGPG